MDSRVSEVDSGLDPDSRSPKKVLAAVTLAVLLGAVLLGLFTTFVLPRFFEELFTTRCPVVESDILAISSAVDQYGRDNDGELPGSLDVLVQPDEGGFSYLRPGTVPRDPWGHEYGYEPNDTHDYRVFTYSSDGVPGGEGKARDIDNLMLRRGEF